MDIVLLKDVERLGEAGAVVKVKEGYARNYLLPTGLAVPATPEQLERLETAKRHQQAHADRLKAQALSVKQKIEARSITLRLNLGEDGKPFGSITAHDVLEALRTDGLALEKHALQLEQPIKALGIYEIPVRLHAEVSAVAKVWVVKE
ncbi:MAG: 50S ribosomal protein L9 [Candidatus Omnitrophica bacterium]|nr:50S ribosomal protein L9 [Candidatus Omnitrophota bacterium]